MKLQDNRKFFRYFLTICLILGVLPLRAYGLSIGPTVIRNSYGPGETAQGVINVYNEAEFPIKVKVEFGDWKFKKDSSGVIEFYPPGSTARSCADWIQVDAREFQLSSKEAREVNYITTFPMEAKGGYYAVIFFVAEAESPLPTAEKDKAIIFIRPQVRLGTIVYNEVKGTAKKASLLSFDVLQPNAKTVKVEYQMKNEGEGYLRVEGKFHIIDDEGKLYGSGNLGTAKMQPQDASKAEGEWLGELPPGEYAVVMTLELGPFGEEGMVKEKRLKIKKTDEGQRP